MSFTLFSSEGDSWLKRAFLPLLAAAMMLPLVFTSGAGAAGSRSFGVTLVGGFLFFALVGLPIATALGKIPLRGKPKKTALRRSDAKLGIKLTDFDFR